MYIGSPPDISDPGVRVFAAMIGGHPKIMANSATPRPGPYPDNLVLLEVQRHPNLSYEPEKCWFNCQKHVQQHPADSIVFGWELFPACDESTKAKAFYANHHSVIRKPNGALVDVSPRRASANDDPVTVFLPDDRVPFDFQARRFPVSIFWDPVALPPSLVWTISTVDPLTHQLPDFALLKG